MVFTLFWLELLSFPVSQHCNSCCTFNCYLNPKSIFFPGQSRKHCFCSYREWAGELKNEGLHGLRKRPWRAWFSAILSSTSVPRGKELVTRDRPVTIQIKALKYLGNLCGRPGCNQKLLLPDGSLGKRLLGFSQHTCTSRKALPPPASQQASSVQRPSKSHQTCSCASNWFLQNKKRNFDA